MSNLRSCDEGWWEQISKEKGGVFCGLNYRKEVKSRLGRDLFTLTLSPDSNIGGRKGG